MKKEYKLLRLMFLAIFLTPALAFAQERLISGKVTDAETTTPIPGVNIFIKNSTTGTVSDIDGNYSISVKEGASLVFSFVGYLSEEITVGSQSVINVSLAPDITELTEIVVIGYGEQQKGDVTGVVEKVNANSFNKGAIVSPDMLIAGKVAGVQISSNNGEPGGQTSIRIRGGTSLNAGNEPLYVIDGVPIDNAAFNPGGFSKGRNPLNFLNPNDIESFTVLKDASAAAIYGSRGANGVIIITTKKGSKDESGIEYNGWYSVGQIADRLEVFNASQFKEILAYKAPQNLALAGDADTDWQDQIYQTAIGQDHNLTFTGGTSSTSYRLSLGYQNQEGVIKTSRTQRTSFNLNVNHLALNDDLRITANLKGSHTKDNFSADVVGAAMEMAPTQPVHDETSPWGGYYVWIGKSGDYERQATTNPVSSLNLIEDEGKVNRSIGNIQLDYKLPFLEGLSANLNLGYDASNGDRRRFQPSYYFPIAVDTGEVKTENFTRMSLLLEIYLNYKADLPDLNSRFDITAGYSWQNFYSEYPSIRATQLSDDSYGFNNPSVAGKVEAFNSVLENRLISFFGRLNYAFMDKYLLTATIRRDGSTRFGPENRWGLFPSAAVAWRISDEPFMQGLSGVFSDLKLRATYGITGNQEIGDYLYLATYTPSTSTAQYQFGNEFINTLRPNGYDVNLKWEETVSYNFGLEYGLLDGRLSGSVEYYRKDTRDLLFERAVPPGTNLTNKILANIGEVRNAGVEVALDALVLTTEKFNWNVSVNFSANRNKIIALDGSDDPSFKGYETGTISGGVGNYIQLLKVGEPAYAFRVYRHKLDENGTPLVDGVDHNGDEVIDLADMYEDLTGDGKVDDNDRLPYKQRSPKYLAGLTTQLSYGAFDLSFSLRGSFGNYAYNNVASNTATYLRANDNFVPRNMLTSVLLTNFNTPQYFSDYYVEDASYVRMDNITLGYNAANLMNGKASLRVYATVQNAFVLTNYTGLDPEIFDGIDNNLYPRSRTFMLGLNFGF